MLKRKQRKDGRYAGYVFLGYNPDGTENRKWVYARTQKELEQKLLEIKLAMAKGEFVANKDITVEQWAKIWLETYKKGKEYKTYQMYDITLREHIVKELGHIKLTELKPFHLQWLINDRAEKGLTKTLVNIKMTAKQMFDDAIENELMIKNPAKKLDMPSIPKNERRVLTDDEIRIIKKADLSPKQKAFIYILLYAGIRREEALALSVSDINLKDNVITINKSVNFIGNKPVLKNYTKSTAGIREIPILDPLKPVLQEYLKTVKGIYLFEPATKGGLMTETAFRSFWKTIWNRLNQAAGGNSKVIAFAKDVTPHILRHTYATMLYYAGVDIKQAQYLLGHANPETTLKIYTHLDKKKSAPTEKLNAYLSVVNS